MIPERVTVPRAACRSWQVLRIIPLTNAQRQRRYRERRKAAQPRVQYRRPHDRRSRPQRWQDAVRTLLDLQGEYQAWLDNLPDSLQESALAQQLEPIAAARVRARLRAGAVCRLRRY